MTVSSIENRWAHVGNGMTTSFAYTNRIFAETDLKVFLNGALRSHGSDYTVSGVGQASGGSVTFAEPPPDSAGVTIVREVPATQGLDLAALGSFPAEENEKALDRLTVLIQQLADTAARSLRQSNSDAATIATLPDKAARASKLLSFDGNGDPLAAAVSATILTAGVGIALPGTTIALDIDGLAEDTAPSLANDFVASWDTSAAAHRKIRLQSLGGGSVAAKTADFTADTTPATTYVVAPSGASAVATLPSAAAVPDGFRLWIKNDTDGKSVTLERAGSDTIDGQAVLRVPGRDCVELLRSGATAWTVVARPAHRVGAIVEWTTNTLPEGGWAWANGQTLSRTAYSGLFAVWGTTYGAGDGSTTFGVRDDRGRVKAGKDDMGGASAAGRLTSTYFGATGTILGSAGGLESHTLTTPQIPAHTHGVVSGTNTIGNSFVTKQADANNSNGVTDSAGGGAAHNNTQPTVIANFIVKT